MIQTGKLLAVGAALVAAALGQPRSAPRAVLLISIDGLRPDYVTEADRHKLKIPNLRRLMNEGAHARSVRGVLPTVTYSSHTTILTGVSPARHGIDSNKPFDPAAKNPNSWYWYSEDIRVPTLWDAAAGAGYVVGSVSWPVTVGAAAIRFNIPEFAGTRTPEDLKMIRALAAPGLMAELAKKAGPYLTDVNQAIPRDWARTRYTVEILREKKARFVTVHLAALDHEQHEHGPFSPSVLGTLEEIDKMVGLLGDAIRAEDPRAAICIVSDHGFAHVDRLFNLEAAFAKAGLKAMSWPAGGSAAIVLNDPRNAAVRAQVKQFLEGLGSVAGNGVAAILDREAISKWGGSPAADFWVDMRPGFAISSSLGGPIVSEVNVRGAHGYSPAHDEMGAFFLIAGQGIRKGVKLGEIDMRSIAPTLARAMEVPFTTADLPPLAVF